MRRTPLLMAASLIVAISLVSPESPAAAGWTPDIAVVTADGRVGILRDGTVIEPVPGRLSGDQRVLVTSSVAAEATTLTWTTLRNGEHTATLTVPGQWRVAVVDLVGTYVALEATGDGTTDVAVVHSTGEVFRTTLTGWVELEAFQTGEGNQPFGIYALAYAQQPQAGESPQYRVRVLSFDTKQLELVQNLRNKSELVDQNMSAAAFGGVVGLNPKMRYSLYRGIEGDHQHEVAFIHIVGLAGPFGAWCFDLDDSMGLLSHPGTLGLTSGGRRLLAVSGTGQVADIDTTTLADQDPSVKPTPKRVVQAWAPTDASQRPMVATAGEWIAVLQGDVVHWLDHSSLLESATTTVGAPADAFTVDENGTLYLLRGGELQIVTQGEGGFRPPVDARLAGGSTAVAIIPIGA